MVISEMLNSDPFKHQCAKLKTAGEKRINLKMKSKVNNSYGKKKLKISKIQG